MSKKVLVAVLAAVVAGVVGGYYVFDYTKNKDVGDIAENSDWNEPSPNAGQEAAESEDQAAEPEVTTLTPDAPEDATFDGVVTFIPSREGESRVVGAILNFGEGYDADRKTIAQAALPGIRLEPARAFNGRWISDRQFEILINESNVPHEQIKVTATELPLTDTTKLTLTGAAQGPWSLSYPGLVMQSAVITEFSPKIRAVIETNWNYPVSGKSVASNVLALLVDENGNEKVMGDLKVVTENKGYSRDHRLTLVSKDLTTGGLKLSINEDLTVIGNKTGNPNASVRLVLSPPTSFQIERASASEGSDSFSLTFQCRLDRQRYYQACRVNAETAKDFITIDPPVNYNVVAGGGKFTLVGSFAAQTAYKIKIKPGLQANDAAVLDTAFERTIRTGKFKPTFRFVGKARYLPSLTMQQIPYEARNVKDLKIQIKQVFPQNIVFWLTQYSENPGTNVSEDIKNMDLTLDVEDDRKFRGKIDLGEFDPVGRGVFAVSVSEKKKNNYHSHLDTAVVIVTDIAAVVKQTRDDIKVYARSMTNLAPLSGVEVRAVSYANRTLAKCTTGGDGCLLEDVMTQEIKPYALIMTKGDDLSYVRFSDLEITDNRVHAGTRPFTQKDVPLESYIYTSRGVYRPGETARLSSLTRTGDRQPADGVPLQWKVKTPRGKTLREAGVKTTEHGFATLDVKMNSYAETGEYLAELWTGDKMITSKSFLVEEFVPERIGLSVKPEKETYDRAGVPKFNIDAKFLFGPPVAEGAYTVRCSLRPAFFTVPGKPEYATGRFSLDEYQPITLDAVSGKLDADGLASVPCDYAVGASGSFPTAMRISAAAEIQEAGSGRVTRKAASALVMPAEHLLGLRKLESQGNTIRVEARLFDAKGDDLQEKRKVKVSLYRMERDYLYGYDPDYGYERWYREEYLLPDGSSSEVELVDGKATIELPTMRSWGRYVVRAEDVESGAVADIKTYMGYYWYWYGGGSDSGTPKARDADQLRVEVDKTEVKAGESFSISFESPIDGQALISLESDVIVEDKWVEVSKGQQKFTFDAPNVLPNLYVSALLVKNPTDGDLFIPARAYGATSIKVTPQDFRFSVDVKAPDVMRPNNDLVIDLSSDNGEDAEYTVAIIDEGILSLTGFATPDPESFFFEPRRLGTQLYDTFGWTFSKTTSETGGDGPGTDGDQGRVMPVRLVAYWSGVVKAEDGKAQVRYAIPPFQGKVRVMVVGSSGQRMSKAETYVTIRDPLVVQPTFPRFLTDGDDFKIPVFVVNMTGKDQEVDVTLKANSSVYLAENNQKLAIEDGRSHTFIFDAKVSDFAGTATFDVLAKAAQFSTEDDATIPILPLTPELTELVAKKGDKPFQVAEIIPANMRTKPVRLQASISTLPNLESFGKMRQLIRYPYGCVEQTTSSTYPLVFMPDLLEFVDPEMAKETDVTNMVQSGISRLMSMQQSSGGFGYWPGSSSVRVWASAYATNMFLDAKKAGFDVPQSALDDALKFLAESVTSRRHNYSSSGEIGDAEAFVHYVLAKAKKPELARLREIADNPPNWGQLNEENRFLIMGALKHAGETKLMESFAQAENLFSIASSNGRRHSYTYWSNFRSDALRLSIGEDVFPGDERLEVLANHVAASLSKRNYWYSTQELAWGVSALGKRLSRMKGVDLKNAGLKVNGKPLNPLTVNNTAPSWGLVGYDPASTVLEMSHNSPVDPYLYVRVVGYAKDYTLSNADSTPVEIERTYFTLSGQKADLNNIKQGDLVVAELKLTNNTRDRVENVAIVDRLPAGLEIENPRLGRSEAISWIDEDARTMFKPDYTDMRDDRIQLFGNIGYNYSNPLTQKYYYVARAVTAGQFNIPPAKFEMMYDGEKYDYTDYGSIKIVSP